MGLDVVFQDITCRTNFLIYPKRSFRGGEKHWNCNCCIDLFVNVV